MYERKKIKREARRAMKAATPHMILVMLVYYLLVNGTGYVVNYLTVGGVDSILAGSLGTFANVLVTLFGIVMSLGFCSYTMRAVRFEKVGVGGLFAGFSMAGRAIGLRFMVALFTGLWGLLFMLPFALCVGVAGALLAIEGAAATVLFAVVVTLLYIALLVALIAVVLRYAMADFALLDHPEDGVMTAIRRSKGMMAGWKRKFFVLQLSFIGWGILLALIVSVVMGIGVAVTGVDWFVSLFSVQGGMSYMQAYEAAFAVMDRLWLWAFLAELAALPLHLWVMAYMGCATARFYNYVGGYDYQQYMDARRTQEPSEAVPQPLQQPDGPAAPVTDDRYYTPVPRLDEPEQRDE